MPQVSTQKGPTLYTKKIKPAEYCGFVFFVYLKTANACHSRWEAYTMLIRFEFGRLVA